MLMRTDPFRDLDRLTQQVFGTVARPAAMPIDAYRDGEEFVVHFDLPGVSSDSIELTVEKNVLTVHADASGPPKKASSCSSVKGRTGPSAASCSWVSRSTATTSTPSTPMAC